MNVRRDMDAKFQDLALKFNEDRAYPHSNQGGMDLSELEDEWGAANLSGESMPKIKEIDGKYTVVFP